MKKIYVAGGYGSADDPTIALLEFDTDTGLLRKISSLSGIPNASFIAQKQTCLLSINESGPDSSLTVVELRDGIFGETVKIPFPGIDPCHISTSKVNDEIAVADYSSGDVAIFKNLDAFKSGISQIINFEGSGPDGRRQKSSHAHCALFSHDGTKIYVCDLGSDRIHILSKKEGTFVHEVSVVVPPGSGPRMMVLDADGKTGYVICELSGKVLVLDLSEPVPMITQEVTADRWTSHGAGDVRLSPDGRYLYASVRLKNDGIAIFSVDSKSGFLSEVGYQPTGKHPRNFQITSDGGYMLVACRDSDSIEVYRRNPSTGLLFPVSVCEGIPRVVCLTELKDSKDYKIICAC
ncbi:MAG: lactonase family protein [Muribaculaceae bacterium]|nr:lactonase family protein [Muribaculaceae bacterium]